MNLDAISRAANENTDPDPSERDFGELMANALRVCLDDLLTNRGPMTDDQRKAMFARLGGGGRPAGGDRSGMRALGNRAPSTLLETAVRVARTPDAVLANARRPLTDAQRRAIFAKGRNGGGGGGGQAVVSRYDTVGGGSRPKSDYRSQVVASAPATGGKSYSRSIAAPGGLAEAQAQNAQRLGSQPAAGRTAVPAGGGQTTAAGTWTPQGGFVPHSPEALQAMASTRAQIAFNKQVGQQLFERALAGLKGGDDPLVGISPMPRDPGSMVYAGGTPNFDERTGRYLTPQETEAKNAQIAELLAKINGQPPAPPVQAPAPTFQLPAIPGPVAPVPEWQPQPQPGGGSGLVGVQPAMPPATYVPPQPQPQPAPQPVPPAPDPPQQPIQQPPAPVAPAPTPPTGGGQSGGTPSWSVPGYGDPALPMMRTPSKAEPAEATKMPQVTPEMLERLRKRIAGEK